MEIYKPEVVNDTIYETKNIRLNFSQIKCVLFLGMLYVSVMLCNAILTNKWISLGNHFVFGGAFVSPLLFILGDIIAEIFGYRVARQIVLFGFICQTLFAVVVELVISVPSPSFWHGQSDYVYVLGSLIKINFGGFVAFLTSSLMNILFITRWKIMLMGRYFWLRSVGSSTIAEACYSALAILIIAFGSLQFHTMLSVILITFIIKLAYSVVFAYPGNLLVNLLKGHFKIDVYDSTRVNVFSFLRRKIDQKNSYSS